MTRGEAVIYLARPQWGPGMIEGITPTGLLDVSFEIQGEYFRGEFGPHELELYTRAQTTA